MLNRLTKKRCTCKHRDRSEAVITGKTKQTSQPKPKRPTEQRRNDRRGSEEKRRHSSQRPRVSPTTPASFAASEASHQDTDMISPLPRNRRLPYQDGRIPRRDSQPRAKERKAARFFRLSERPWFWARRLLRGPFRKPFTRTLRLKCCEGDQSNVWIARYRNTTMQPPPRTQVKPSFASARALKTHSRRPPEKCRPDWPDCEPDPLRPAVTGRRPGVPVAASLPLRTY